jgi:hypothetical protein
MTREAAKELLPIITAFAEGKEIEVRWLMSERWVANMDGNFNLPADRYRIKPEPPPLIERWALVTKNNQIFNQWVERSNAERSLLSANPEYGYRLVHLREVQEESK